MFTIFNIKLLILLQSHGISDDSSIPAYIPTSLFRVGPLKFSRLIWHTIPSFSVYFLYFYDLKEEYVDRC